MNIKFSLIKAIAALWIHISSRRRVQLILLLLLTAATSFAEIISIGAIFPILAVLTSPEEFFTRPYVEPLIDLIQITDPGQLVLLLIILFIVAALISGFIRLTLLWVQTKLSFSIGYDISNVILSRTLNLPYKTHLNRNSSDVINVISFKSTAIVGGTLLPILSLIASIALIVVFLTSFFLINPIVSITLILVFGLYYVCIFQFTKQKLNKNGKVVATESTLALKSLQEAFGGIREVIIFGCQEVYCRIFGKANLALRRAQAGNFIISQMPRYIAETLSIVVMAVSIYIISLTPGGLQSAIPFIGALALAAQKMLPAFQQIFSNLSSIRANHANLVDVLEYLNHPTTLKSKIYNVNHLHFSSAIYFRDVSFNFNSNKKQVLSNLNLTIKKGSRVGFIGTSGSGKSTLLDLVMGLLQPISGTIYIDNVVLNSSNARSWQAQIAHVPQSIYLSDSTIAENIAFGVDYKEIDLDQVILSAKAAMIDEVINQMPNGYNTHIGERGVRLSGGQRQRIGIARALYRKAEVIILDEATSALDDVVERALMESLYSIGPEITILIVAHRLSTLKQCNSIIEINEGKVEWIGSYDDLILKNSESIT